jgi:hypothetical protein
MHPMSSPVRRSSRSIRGVTSRFNDYTPSAEFDDPSLYTPCDQYHVGAQIMGPMLIQQPVPHTVQPLSGTSQQYAQQCHNTLVPTFPTHPCITCNPYPTPTSPYDQQNATQHMIQATSSDENKVFVSDGYSWKEFNLEKIFSC